MILATTPRLARLAGRVRLVILVLFALLVAHDAIYLARFGEIPHAGPTAIVADQHAYWLPASLLIATAAGGAFVAAITLIVRLQRSAPAPSREDSGPAYGPEIARTWTRLFPAVAILFGIQENVEHFLAGGLPGLDPLFGPGADLAMPVLAITTFVLAAVGALLRWRIAVLEARLVARSRPSFPRSVSARQPSAWRAIAAAVAHGWIVVRRDAGRAPPVALLI